jgi:hypothetical protein
MMFSANKVTTDHLRRAAYRSVRQSSLQPGQDPRESTARPYALKGRAQALGWTTEQTVVIDEDQGRSGASAAEAPASSGWSPRSGSGRSAW